MKNLFLSLCLTFSFLGFLSTVHASNDPIPGVDVIVEKVPPGHTVGWVRTNPKGLILLRGNFEPGYYEVVNRAGNRRAGIRHRGGSIRWQLLKSGNRRQPWKVIQAR